MLQSIHGLCHDETYGAITKYNNGEEVRDNDRNEDGNDNNNVTSGSGSDGLVFDPIATHWSHRGGSGGGDDGTAAAAAYISIRWNMINRRWGNNY